MSSSKKKTVSRKSKPPPRSIPRTIYRNRPVYTRPVYQKQSVAPMESDSNKFLGIEKPNSLGANIGAFVGHGAQQLIKAITGFGDYHIDKNSIIEGGMTPPQVVNTVNRGGFIVRHREYIADIVATTAFSNSTYDINPGLNGSFPYLSQIAKAFELYRMRGLVYEFKSTSSDAVLSSSASSALGVVAMATQYNSLNSGFTNLIAMQNHEFATASKPSCDFYHPVECKKSLLPASELYVRSGSVPSGADIRLFDLGQFNIATSGMQNATGIIGQLWATYEVEFYQAKYDAPTGILSDHIYGTGCATASPLGTAHIFLGGDSLGLSVDNTTLEFPGNIRDGNYLILLRYVSASSAWVAPTLTTQPTKWSLLQVWNNGTDPSAGTTGNSADVTSTTFHLVYLVKIIGPNAQFVFSGGTVPTSKLDIFVTQFDADIIS